jgi:hypothetical protein
MDQLIPKAVYSFVVVLTWWIIGGAATVHLEE